MTLFIYLGGPAGNQGTFGQLGASNPNFPSDADHTATIGQNGEVSGGLLRATSSVPLTAPRRLILPLIEGMVFDVFNDTTGGQTINVGGSSGASVPVPIGQTIRCACSDGANYTSESGTAPAALVPTELVYGGGGGGVAQDAGLTRTIGATNVLTSDLVTISNPGGSALIASAAPLTIQPTSDGGSVTIQSADGVVGDGGQITLTAGNATVADNNGGVISVTSGNGIGAGVGGDLNLIAGSADQTAGTGSGGNFNFTAGSGGINAGPGGLVNITGGSTPSGTDIGGSINLTGGDMGSFIGSQVIIHGAVPFTAAFILTDEWQVTRGGTSGGNLELSASQPYQTTGPGGYILLTAGNGGTSSMGGTIEVFGGDSVTPNVSGNVTITGGGSGFSVSQTDCGSVFLDGGSASAGNVNGGSANIAGGNGAGTGIAGVVSIVGGNAGNATGPGADGGEVTIVGGRGNNAGLGGPVLISGGIHSGFGASKGGSVTIIGGFSTANNAFAGGDVTLAGGPGDNGAGGNVFITGGSPIHGEWPGGSITVQSGSAVGVNSPGGDIPVTAGNGSGTGTGGTISFTTGNSPSGNAGNFAIAFGTGGAANGLLLLTGATTAATASAGADILPATPAGFWTVNINGTVQKIPFYNN